MSQQYYITSRAFFDSKMISINGEPFLTNDENEDFKAFSKKVYKKTELNYPKFYKMDNISKLGFITSELLLSQTDFSEYAPERIAVYLANSNSTLATDEIFFNSLKAVPSPAVFVYTLPNIMIGEICIKNGFKGENSFFICREYQPDFIYRQIEMLFEQTDTDVVITGWVDFDYIDPDNYKAILCVIEKKENRKNCITFASQNMSELAIKT